MKTLTVTIHHSTNYGATLQAYALQQALVKMGHENVIFEYPYANNNTTRTNTQTIKSFLRNCYLRLISRGETDKSVSFKDPKLFELITRFVEESGYVGTIDIDIFRVKGEYYISEVNPRFGGGYLHTHESGVNFPRLLINNLQGVENQVNIGDYPTGTVMMKYNEVMVQRR